jgi:arylsulfatase A-like enzyme
VNLPLDDREPTLAEALRANGYLTSGIIANWSYCHSRYGLARGFTHYDDAVGTDAISLTEILSSSPLTDRIARLLAPVGVRLYRPPTPRREAGHITSLAIDWLDQNATSGRPFFLFLNYLDAHSPYSVPSAAPLRRAPSREVPNSLVSAQRRWFRAASHPENRPAGMDHEGVVAKAKAATADIRRFETAIYEDCISWIDSQIARLLADLDRRGELERTIVIVTSDHGEHFGEHGGLILHGHTLYRELIHVPLVMKGPGVPILPNQISEPVSLRDLAPTVLDLAGISAEFPGHSLSRHWTGKREPGDSMVIAEVEHQKKDKPSPLSPASHGAMAAIVTRDYTLIRNVAGAEELYDMRADRAEAKDIARDPKYAPVLDSLRDTLMRTAPVLLGR